MKMNWRLLKDEANAIDVHGLGAFAKRLEESAARGGGPLKGFTFLEDGRQMLTFSREIEHDIVSAGEAGPLYVGFQNAGKLEKEAGRYQRMRAGGVTVFGFGEGDPEEAWARGLSHWKTLPADHSLLENQWFLISLAPEPIAFVGWEVSADEIWGEGGISTPDKTFAGFVSGDMRVVEAMIGHLEDVRLDRKESSDDRLKDAIAEVNPRRIIALVDEGQRSYLARTLPEVAEAAGEAGAELFLYDLSAASYLVSPYPDEDERWMKPKKASALRRALGRSNLANLVDAAATKAGTVWGILPEKVGFAHLAQWCKREHIDTVVIPVEFSRPSLLERLQGLTLQSLADHSVGVTIVVDDPVRGAWVVPAAIEEGVPA